MSASLRWSQAWGTERKRRLGDQGVFFAVRGVLTFESRMGAWAGLHFCIYTG